MPHSAAALTPPAARHRTRRPWHALALSACLLAVAPLRAAEEFTADGTPTEVAADPSGRVTFALPFKDVHYWIRPRTEDERTALLEALRSLKGARSELIVTFSITGAGIPDGESRLEYRALRIRRLEGARDVYVEPAGPPPPARPELRVVTPLDSALLLAVPLYLSGRFDEAVAELDDTMDDLDEPVAEKELWKVILARKTRGLALARREHPEDGQVSEDGDRGLLAALEDLRAWQRLAPGNLEAHYAIGRALEQLGAYREALGLYADTARRFPQDTFWPTIRTAAVYRQMRDYPTALATLGKLREAQRNSMPYHYHRGWTLESAGRDAEAIAEYTAGLKAQPDFPWALLRRACVRSRAGQRADALADDRQALALLEAFPPSVPEAQHDLAAGRQIAAQLESDAATESADHCTQFLERDGYRARSALLPARIDWLPLSRTPPKGRGLAALSATQFRLLVLAVLALVVGTAVVLLRKFATPR